MRQRGGSGGPDADVPQWVSDLIATAKRLLPPDFVGQVEINAYKGGISNVNIKQSFKEDTAK